MLVDVTIKEDQNLWKSRYEYRSNRELAVGKMIWASVPHQRETKHITISEWEYYRTLYRREAVRIQKELGADVVVYAMAKPGPDGGIGSVEFGILALTMDEYQRFGAENPSDMVYSVFSRGLSNAMPSN